MDTTTAISSFSALGQRTRLDALRLLIQAGQHGLLAGEIGARLDVRQNTMSANLAVLSNAGLVRSERQGRSIRYFAELSAIGGLLSFLMEDCCGGNPEQCKSIIDKITFPC